MKKTETFRTCIVCREKKDRREMIRVVRSPEGKVFLDHSQKANGRGAYLCRDKKCIENAKKKNRLKQALKVSIDEQFYEELFHDVEE